MRVLALFLAAFLSIVFAAEAPIATAGACAPACPSTDKDGFALNHQSDDEDANTITCTYGEPDDDSYCTYNAVRPRVVLTPDSFPSPTPFPSSVLLG